MTARKLDGNEYHDLDLDEIKSNLKDQNIDINIPKRYVFDSFMMALDFVNTQNCEFQGLVMKYNGFRSKIRNLNIIELNI